MENISDEAISFQEYKSKWEESKRISFIQEPNILKEKINYPLSFSSNTSILDPNFSMDDITMISLHEFIDKYRISPLSDFQNRYKNCVLLRISSKSMILLFISIVYFKGLIENFYKDRTFEDLIKRLEFFKYQVSRTKQLKLIENLKIIKSRIEANLLTNALHSLITFIISDKIFREGIIDLMQEIVVDLILNSNFHHIIQNRNIELKRFILQLRNSKTEEELLTDELKTLISKCFEINFNISHLNLQRNTLYKESFGSNNKIYDENVEGEYNDVFNQNFLDFLVLNQTSEHFHQNSQNYGNGQIAQSMTQNQNCNISQNNEKNDKTISFVVLREQDYESYFLTKLTNNSMNFQKNDSNLLNKENFERKFSINISNLSANEFLCEPKILQSPKESLRKRSMETRNIGSLNNFFIDNKNKGVIARRMKSLIYNLEEDTKILERNAGLF